MTKKEFYQKLCTGDLTCESTADFIIDSVHDGKLSPVQAKRILKAVIQEAFEPVFQLAFAKALGILIPPDHGMKIVADGFDFLVRHDSKQRKIVISELLKQDKDKKEGEILPIVESDKNEYQFDN